MNWLWTKEEWKLDKVPITLSYLFLVVAPLVVMLIVFVKLLLEK